jgi:hypothetical protein
MSDPGDKPRPRDYALESELESLRKQEAEGHATPKEQARAEQLERRLHKDEDDAELTEQRQEDRDIAAEDAEYRHRHRHH